MDEIGLRALLERAVEEEPPMGLLVSESLHAGKKLARRRRIEAAIAAVAAVALLAVVVPAALGALRPGSKPRPAAAGHASATAFVWTTANAVTPIRLSTGRTLRAARVTGHLTDIAAAPGGNAAYAFSSTSTSNFITRIDGSTGRAGRTFRIADYVEQAVIAPDGRTAYALTLLIRDRNNYPALVAINLATGASHTVLTGASLAVPWAVTLVAQGNYAYTIASSRVVAVNMTTGRVRARIRIQHDAPASLAILPGTQTVYVTTPFSMAREDTPVWLTPVSFATGKAGTPIKVQARAAYFGDDEVAIAPDGRTAYIYGGKIVVPVDLATGKPMPSIDVAVGNSLPSFSSAPGSATAYVTWNTKWLQPISLSTSTAERELIMPGGYTQSAPLAFSPDGDVAYVPAALHGGDAVDAVIPLSTSTQHFGAPIKVRGRPLQIVVIP
jgi:hypothetical protein